MQEDLKKRLFEVEARLGNLGGIFDREEDREEIARIEEEMSRPGFWGRLDYANKYVIRLKDLKSKSQAYRDLCARCRELKELMELGSDDKDFVAEIDGELKRFSEDISRLELNTVLCGPLDKNSAILSINAGAGGTEACDWADMLLRMYLRWAEARGYDVRISDVLPGEEAGIKNVTVLIEGEYAYGYLKCESGVHRLVRISPFDANKRRHTSFASVAVIAKVSADIDIKIRPEELKIDVYRSRGHGGQSVNTTDSAVRITHIPSGIVVQCQNERSQYQNKQVAMSILRARIYEEERRRHEEDINRQYAQKKKIEWGSQIRSYVMHPYNMVKDHRTDHETGDVTAVMNGKIDGFIEAYLKRQTEERKTK
ncbi:MAG: peptide chain release factor 2, partial [Candidatus Omnitrophota bacterium]